MNILERGLSLLTGGAAPAQKPAANAVTVASLGLTGTNYVRTDADAAMKLSTVNRCIEILSDSIGKMPFYVFDSNTRERVDHPICELLSLRPNNWQTPFVCKKQMECERINGNGIAYIERDRGSLQPTALVPIPKGYWSVQLSPAGELVYNLQHPFTGKTILCGRMDVVHVMAYTRNGYLGISYLERAADVIKTARSAQEYASSYYLNGGQPGGILKTDSDLAGSVTVQDADGTERTISKKDYIREEWEKRQAGPENAQRIAVLDLGLDYKPIAVSQRDAQFVEQAALSVEDIARFFGVPLYKLQAGKQSYSSNEQNAIEYVTGTLHPNATLWEQELTYKLLSPQDIKKGLQIRGNLMAELRGDAASRAAWYQKMREIGGFSANDIRALEDLPDVEGGDDYYASLNYVPLSVWEDLSIRRASSDGRNGGEAL